VPLNLGEDSIGFSLKYPADKKNSLCWFACLLSGFRGVWGILVRLGDKQVTQQDQMKNNLQQHKHLA